MELVGSRLGEDLDAAEARLVKLRRERIVIHAHLADRARGRNAPAGEAVNEDLAPVGTGGGSGQRSHVVGEIVAVIRQRVQIRAAEHQRTGVGGRIEVDLRRVCDCDPLDLHAQR